jgi:hypothetical protein
MKGAVARLFAAGISHESPLRSSRTALDDLEAGAPALDRFGNELGRIL